MTFQRFFNNKRRSKGNKGAMLADVLVAIALMSAFMITASSSLRDAEKTFEYARERSALLDAFVQFQNSDLGKSDIVPGGNGLMTVEDEFAIDINTNDSWYGNDAAQRNIKIEPQSTTTGPYAQSVAFDTLKAYSEKIGHDHAGAPLCSVDFTNGKPATVNRILLPVDHGLNLTDIEIRDDVAYISADSSVYADSDIFVIDIRDRASPVLLGELNTGPGISSIALAGYYIYAAAASSASQLHIIRMGALGVLALERRFELIPPHATATLLMASAIFYDSDAVFLGTQKWEGPEFNIIDVSDPQNPRATGAYEIDSKVTDIFVRGHDAYVSSASPNQLIFLDISDTKAPAFKDGFSPSGWSRQEGKVAVAFEDKLGFARTSGGFDIQADHELFAWSPRGSSSSAYSINIPGGVYGIVIDRKGIFAATREYDREFQHYILDEGEMNIAHTESLPVAPEKMTCYLDGIFILSHNSPFVYEIKYDK